ncbi:fluoride efflux transporter CrcB [Roseibacillus ishigakijimensis]|uniref:Fluoride-specific ion channel FluC n=1 Tax=Roseibacillus ishigakijimensis TaxID=454146 RepID=A0A934VNU8_9BACT|nr:fluoride efflux transporter CrcB [Roseibacillus ishigakijimensis]MBK1835415.1 fluoride efflux transporter CrcB [Roseibacillus ishigakijimensis]
MNLVLVFLGGGLGAVARYGLNSVLTQWLGGRFPLGILACNVLGCFLIGLAAGFAQKTAPGWLGPFVIVGFLGGFTTFSTFSSDNLALLREGSPGLACLNIMASLALGLLAVAWGWRLTTS